MPRYRRKRPNWPYRLTWVGIILALLLYLAVQTVTGTMSVGNRAYGTDWTLAFIASCLDTTIAIWFVAVGSCIGSFLNVVAYRIPLGRYIGGHSGCPFCQTPIDGLDNVPVLAWVKLRGRCRACRLPISVQYPLVELTVAIIFLVVYVTEFSSGGANLPAVRSSWSGRGLVRVTITPELIVRTGIYLFALSGLVAAALIAVRRKIVPLKLYLWSLLPLVVASCAMPSLIVVPWRSPEPLSPFEARLDVIATLLCGMVAGIAMARLLAPVIFGRFDRSLFTSDPNTAGARQFIGAMGVVGALVGWQAIVAMSWCMVLSALLGVLLCFRWRRVANLADMTVWVWLGLLIFRSAWSWIEPTHLLPNFLPEVAKLILGALLLAPLCLAYRRLASVAAASDQQILPADHQESQADLKWEVVNHERL